MQLANEFDEDSNSTNSVIVGVRLKPTHYWSIYGDFEKGQADNVFVRLANNDYGNIRVRSVTYLKRWTINLSGLLRNNDNPGMVTPNINGVPSNILGNRNHCQHSNSIFLGKRRLHAAREMDIQCGLYL